MMKKKNHLVWLDMEMTGLDPDKERIIELAIIITDAKLNIVEEGPNLVIHQPSRVLKAMDQWNQSHHSQSGLIEAVQKSKLNVGDVEKKALNFVKKYCFPKISPLCGNSIHHDKRFLRRYMPRLHDYFHYRLIDVSTIKEVIQRWYPGRPKLLHKADCHRALSDIRESIQELKFYLQHYFKPQSPRMATRRRMSEEFKGLSKTLF